ncbi:MAG: flagellin [Phycisphaerales bacterium]
MARISTNIASLIAQHNLARSNENLEVRLQRLSTGLRINRGADDPAGLIVSERLRSELSGIGQGINNAERASSVISTAEAALTEVSDLLSSIRALVVEAANSGAVSQEEKRANQLQIDSAIDSITRIANTTSFAGLKLLDGSLDYITSGVNTTNIAASKINAVNFGTRANVPVQVQVIGSAQTASIYISAAAWPTSGVLPSAVTLEVQGPEGVRVFDFASGISLDQVITAINSFTDATGVTASRVNAGQTSSGIQISSQAYGSNAFVSVRRLGNSGTFLQTYQVTNNGAPPVNYGVNTTATQRDTGKDVQAIVNGSLAVGRGLGLSVRSGELDLEMTLQRAYAQTVPGAATTFYVTGGGALYQLGPNVNSSQQTNIAIPSLVDSRLGATLITPVGSTTPVLQFLNSLKTGGANDLLKGNFIPASKILESAIDQVSVLRGRLGAFERNTLQTNVRSLQSALENVTAATSQIRDADFAVETSNLTRAQVLTQAGTSVLATANAQVQNVLALLGR